MIDNDESSADSQFENEETANAILGTAKADPETIYKPPPGVFKRQVSFHSTHETTIGRGSAPAHLSLSSRQPISDAALIIQNAYRKSRMQLRRKQLQARFQRCVNLTNRYITIEDLAQQAQIRDAMIKMKTLTPGILRWILWHKDSKGARPGVCHCMPGAIVHIKIEKLTDFARQVNQVKHWNYLNMTGELVQADEKPAQVTTINGDILLRFWEMLITQVHKFHGDAVELYDDTVKVIFPTEPLFGTQAKSPGAAKSLTQSRALLFALEVLVNIQNFRLEGNALAKDHIKPKIVVAYGTLNIHIAGTMHRRVVLLSGDCVECTATLCDKYSDGLLVHQSIGDVKDRIVHPAEHVRLRVGSTQPTTQILHERLLTSKDYISLSQQENPYFDLIQGRGSRARPLPSLQTFAKVGKTKSSKAVPGTYGGSIASNSLSRAISLDSLGEEDTGLIFNTSTRSFADTSLQGSLASFVTNKVFSDITLGCFVSQLERIYCSILTVVIPDIVSNEIKLVPEKLQQLISGVIEVTTSYIGEVLACWIDGRGLVISASFGVLSTLGENHALAAAFGIQKLFEDEKDIQCSIGIASGFSKIGLIGGVTRFVYAIIGDVPKISESLAARASTPKQYGGITRSTIMIDQDTFLGCSQFKLQRFIVFEIFVRGFEASMQAFLPLMKDENIRDLDDNRVLTNIGILGNAKVVRVTNVSKRTMQNAELRNRQHNGFVADISRLTLGLENYEVIQTVLKIIAVMGMVSTRLDTDILPSLPTVSVLSSDVEYALTILQQDLQLIRYIASNQYIINDVKGHITPIYESLMPAYRRQLHKDLGSIYAERLLLGDFTSIPKHRLQVMIGTHYAHAGVQYHFEGASYLNQALPVFAHEQPTYGVLLGSQSYRLVRSWQRKQLADAEATAAFAQYQMAKFQRRMGQQRISFCAFVACLRSYKALSPFLHSPCPSIDSCEYEKGTLEECQCHKLEDGLRAYVFIHHAPDPYSSFSFRCLEISSEATKFLVNPTECTVRQSIEETPDSEINCRMYELSFSEVRKFYDLPMMNTKVNKFYRLIIMNRDTSKHILNSFLQLASISLKTMAMDYVKKEIHKNPSERSLQTSQNHNIVINARACILQ